MYMENSIIAHSICKYAESRNMSVHFNKIPVVFYYENKIFQKNFNIYYKRSVLLKNDKKVLLIF